MNDDRIVAVRSEGDRVAAGTVDLALERLGVRELNIVHYDGERERSVSEGSADQRVLRRYSEREDVPVRRVEGNEVVRPSPVVHVRGGAVEIPAAVPLRGGYWSDEVAQTSR